MPDLAHVYGNDLSVSANGDLALSDGTTLGQERVLRRLLTAPGAYIWQLDYGAGLPRFVGEVANKARIAAVARSQIHREDIVARTPAPVITVDVQPNSVVTLDIQYVDTATQAAAGVNFSLNG